MVERWRPIPGYEDIYEVSDHGLVRSLPRVLEGRYGPTRYKGRVLRPGNANLYPTYILCVEGERKTFYAYALVMLAFLGPCPDGMEVRHWDGDRSNTRFDNLIYGTRSENMQDKDRHGRHARGEKSVRAKLTNDQALQLRAAYRAALRGRERLPNGGMERIAEDFGLAYGTTRNIAYGGGYVGRS